VVGGGLYIANQQGMFAPSSTTSALTAPAPAPTPAPAAPVQTAPAPANPPVVVVPPPAPSGPTAAQREQVRVLVTDARRAITRGDFNAADRALDQAERIDPRSSDVVAARRDLRDAQQQANRNDRRVDGLVAQARAAIQRHDYAAADHLLDQAESIDRTDRDVQQARAELNTAQRTDRPGPGPGPGRR
jgi:Tfp pilus assembly protein PilF